MKNVIITVLLLVFFSCKGPEPRKPLKVSTGTSIKASIKRSKALLAKEEKMIHDIIKKDTLHNYKSSGRGSWFYYISKNEATDETIQPNDIVKLKYNVLSFDNDTIYSMNDIGVLEDIAKKLPLFPGLRSGLQILKEGETATFLFPSSLAFGYHGDTKKIGINTPLKSTVSILGIRKFQDSLLN